MKINNFTKQSLSEKISSLNQASIPEVSLEKLDKLSENVIGKYNLPFSIAPNVLINNKYYHVPMVVEESSVVAAASSGAKFWESLGGIKANVLSFEKFGHIHFICETRVFKRWYDIHTKILEKIDPLLDSMKKRGGGLNHVSFVDKTSSMKDYYQLEFRFNTCDAMGANFINTVLEEYAQHLKEEIPEINIVMNILSNFNSLCLVEAYVECPIEMLPKIEGYSSQEFAQRMKLACDIAQVEPKRACTHNKGIMNGIDSVIIATGNDFRAVEAACHAYAAKDGSYRSLSQISLENGLFKMSLTLPLAIGTVGGVASIHETAKKALEILENPSAKELMQITASVGLVQNFSALKALVTSGIQKGHMKLHLENILLSLNASEKESQIVRQEFSNRKVSSFEVKEILNKLRQV